MRDTIEMAREAGLIKAVDCCGVPHKFCGQDEWKGNLKAFEALVRADAIADERDKWMERTAILIRGEREACALIAEIPISGEQDDITMQAKDRVAAAIRARGEIK